MINKKFIILSFFLFLGLIVSTRVVNAGVVTVTTPATLTTGAVYNITWTAWTTSGTLGSYTIQLCRGGSGNSCSNSYSINSNVTGNSGSYSWAVPASLSNSSDYRINIYNNGDTDAGATPGFSGFFTITGSTTFLTDPLNCGGAGYVCPTGTSCVNGTCSSSGSTTTTNCDSSSFLSSSSAFDFQAGGSKTGLCGAAQYFKTNIPAGKTCDIKWTLTSDANSDYDLYIKNDSSLTRNVYDLRSIEGAGAKDEIIKSGLSSGVYYAMADKASGTGSYLITTTIANCSGSASVTTTTPATTTTTNATTDAKIVQLQNQINQLLSQISQLQSDLARMQNATGQASTTSSGTNGCYTFTTKLKYKDAGYVVGSLQAILKRAGLYPGLVSGYFGQGTASAVTAFQEKYASEILTPFSLASGTGFVGNSTISKLNQLYGCK